MPKQILSNATYAKEIKYKKSHIYPPFLVVPAFNGHFCIQAKVSLHGRCPLIGGTGML